MDNLSYQIVYDKSSFIFGLAEQDSLMCQNIVQTERLHLVFTYFPLAINISFLEN